MVWANRWWCCFDPFSSVQSKKEESSRKSESVCCLFFPPPPLTHWIYEERRGGGGRWRKVLLRGDYSQRGAWRDIPGPHISFATSDFQIKWAQSADQNEIFLIDSPESLAGSPQIESCVSCIIINHSRLQGCRNWADAGKYVTDAWGQGKSSSYWPGSADLVCP